MRLSSSLGKIILITKPKVRQMERNDIQKELLDCLSNMKIDDMVEFNHGAIYLTKIFDDCFHIQTNADEYHMGKNETFELLKDVVNEI